MGTNNTPSFFKNSAFSALVFFGTLIVLSVAYAAYQVINSSEYAPGAPMTSSLMGKMAGNIDNLNTRLTSAEATIASQATTISTLSSSWAIMAFNLATCPTGWSAADGTGGRPDLRGRFIRGIDNGAGNDPDCASRTGWCVIGSTQADELKSHTFTCRNDCCYGGNLRIWLFDPVRMTNADWCYRGIRNPSKKCRISLLYQKLEITKIPRVVRLEGFS